MDQRTIGEFIAECRRARGMTQKALADMLYISDKAVSKWERGRGAPDISLLLPLCDALGITVTELMRGERIEEGDAKRREEEQMLRKIEERALSHRAIVLSIIVMVITLLGSFTLIMLSGLLDIEVWLRIVLIAIAFLIMAGGIAVVTVLDANAGTYECPMCGRRFVPTMGAYLGGAHTLTRRWLKCPECGKSCWCIRRLTH